MKLSIAVAYNESLRVTIDFGVKLILQRYNKPPAELTLGAAYLH